MPQTRVGWMQQQVQQRAPSSQDSPLTRMRTMAARAPWHQLGQQVVRMHLRRGCCQLALSQA